MFVIDASGLHIGLPSCLCSAALDDLETWNLTAVQSRRQPSGSCHWALCGHVQPIKVVL